MFHVTTFHVIHVMFHVPRDHAQERRAQMRKAWRWPRRARPTVSGWSSGHIEEHYFWGFFDNTSWSCCFLSCTHIRFVWSFVGMDVFVALWKTTVSRQLRISWKEEVSLLDLVEVLKHWQYFFRQVRLHLVGNHRLGGSRSCGRHVLARWGAGRSGGVTFPITWEQNITFV